MGRIAESVGGMPAHKSVTTIHVACCFDDAMAIPASVVAASAAAATQDAHVMFYMLHPPKLSIQIADLKGKLDSDRFTVVDQLITDDLSGLHKTKQYSEAMYFRYLLPQLLDEPRVIYLDSDTMVRRSLTELYATDLKGRPIAAAKDYALTLHMRDHGLPVNYRGRYIPIDEYCLKVLDFDLSTTDYFNSGVLVMDLDMWRRTDMSEQFMLFCRENPGLNMADQDAGNHVLQGNFLPLDARWNSFSYLYREYIPIEGKRLPLIFGGFEKNFRPPTGEWLEIITKWAYDPWIVHFSYRSKPWEAHHRRTDYDDEYWQHASNTPFVDQLRARYEASKKIALAESIAQQFPLRHVRAAVRRAQHLLRKS